MLNIQTEKFRWSSNGQFGIKFLTETIQAIANLGGLNMCRPPLAEEVPTHSSPGYIDLPQTNVHFPRSLVPYVMRHR